MRPSEQIENLVKENRYKFDSETREKVFNNVLQEIEQNKTQNISVQTPALRSIIMKSSKIKIAAAAIILIAVLVGLNPFKSAITFSQIIEPILNADSMILDLIIGNEDSGTIIHDVVEGSRIRRTVSNLPNMIQILDLENGKMLSLETESRSATHINIEGQLQSTTQSYVDFLKYTIRQVREGEVEQIGEQVIDGRKAVVFSAKGQQEQIKIWADSKTGYPLKIELNDGTVFKNFQIDVSIDNSLLSMEIPEGYTEKNFGIDISQATEQDFIESLRIWATILGEGIFPETIDTEATMKIMPVLIGKIKQMKNISQEEGIKMGINAGLGMLFQQKLDLSGNPWKYVGAGVKFDESQKPVFWYQPEGSSDYRVVYGDLHVEDVSQENLPK